MPPKDRNPRRVTGLLWVCLGSCFAACFQCRAAEFQPYSGTPVRVPGVLEAEYYDRGGEGAAFHSTGPANLGTEQFPLYFRLPPGREPGGISDVSDTGADWLLIKGNEWANYTIHCVREGYYSVQLKTQGPPVRWVGVDLPFHTGTPEAGRATLHLEVDGADVTGPVEGVTNTVCPRIWLDSGVHTLRIHVDSVQLESHPGAMVHWSWISWPIDLIRIQSAEVLRVPVLVAGGVPGFADGDGSVARFGRNLMIAGEFLGGDLLVVDPENSALRNVSKAGVVRTLAGIPGNPVQDGRGVQAGFASLREAIVTSGDVSWVLESKDPFTDQVRRVGPDGGVTTAYSGRPRLEVPTPEIPGFLPPITNTMTVALTRLVPSPSGGVDVLGPIVQRVQVDVVQGLPVYRDVEWHVVVRLDADLPPEVRLVRSPMPADEGWLGGGYRLTKAPNGCLVFEDPPGFPQEALPGVAPDSVVRTGDDSLFAITTSSSWQVQRLDPGVPERSGVIPGSMEILMDQRLRFRVYGDRLPLRYRVRVSPDLKTWSDPNYGAGTTVDYGTVRSLAITTEGDATTVTLPPAAGNQFVEVLLLR